MRLREHPLMSYHGLPNWPPVWTWVGAAKNRLPKGELGTLQEVTVSNIESVNRLFLYIEYENARYIGCLLFDNPPFCLQIANVVRDWCGHPIREIGALELSFTL
jgi:hypothetical protein